MNDTPNDPPPEPMHMNGFDSSMPAQWKSLAPERRHALLEFWWELGEETREMLRVWMADGWQPTPEDLADLLKLERGEETPDEQVERLRRALRPRLG